MADVDLSMFDTTPSKMAWKVSPEEQQQRDQSANDLRQTYEPDAPSIQADDKAMRAAQQKPRLKLTSTQVASVDLSMFDDKPAAKKASVDLSMFGPSNTAQATSGAMTALDFLAPVGTAVGGVSALGGLAMDTLTGQDDKLARAVTRTHQYEDWNPSGIAQKMGVPKEYVESKIAQVPMEKLQDLSRYVGEKVQDITGSAGAAAITDVGIQALVIGLLTHGVIKVGDRTIKMPERPTEAPEAPPKPPDVSSAFHDMPEGMSMDPAMSQRDMFNEQAAKDTPWKTDENGMPYKERLETPAQQDLFAPETRNIDSVIEEKGATSSAKPGFQQDAIDHLNIKNAEEVARKKSPPVVDEQGWGTEAPVDAGMGRTEPYLGGTGKKGFNQGGAVDISDIGKMRDKKAREEDLIDAQHADTSTGFFKDLYPVKWQVGDRVVHEGKIGIITESGYTPIVKFADGKEYPVHQTELSKVGPRKTNKGTFGQSGSSDWFGAVERMKAAGKTWDDTPKVYELGDSVRLASGKSGVIIAKLENDYQVRISPRDGGGFDFVPHGAIMNRSIVGGVGKKGFNQGGAVDINRQQAQDHRPWNEIKEALGFSASKPLKAAEDMSKFSRTFDVAPIMAQNNFKSRTGQLMKNIISRTQEWHNKGINKYRDAVAHVEDFAKQSRSSKNRSMDIAIKFDGMLNDELVNRGLQWPTRDMLAEKGLNEKEIGAYLEQTKGVDKGFDMIDEVLRIAGQDPVTRIPGFFPHFWSGVFKVKLVAGGKDISMKPFDTKWGADRFAAQAKKEGFNTVTIYPSSHIRPNNIAASIIEGMNIYGSKKGLGKPLLDMLVKFDELSKRGIIKSALEREANLAGFDAEKGITNNWFHNNRMIDAYRTYIESASKFWTHGQIARDVYAPFLRDIRAFEDVPHFKAAVGEFIQRNSGQPVNHFSWIDEFLRQRGLDFGFSPNLVPAVAQGLGRFMTFTKLIIPNPRFLASQIVQPIAAAADISLFHEQRRAAGGKLGNPVKAWAVLLKEFATIDTPLRDADSQAALDWAWKNNKIDVYNADHINPIHAVDAVNTTHDIAFYQLPRWIENRGRAASFLANYTYFKDVMPREEALHAAANGVDINMGNYEAGNSASMYTDLGVIGRSMRPFALIRNAYLGKALMAGQLAVDGLKTGNPIKAGLAATPLGLMMGSYIMFAGASGVFGANEWDVLARWYNTEFKPDTPLMRPGEFMRKYGLPDWAIYGALGDSLGMDVGPSLAAPAMNELGAFPGLTAGKAAFDLTKEGTKELFGNGANVQNIYAAVRTVAPNIMMEPMEQWVANKQGGNIPGTTSFDAKITRTPQESLTYKLTGARAISEVDRRQQLSLYNSTITNNKTWKSDQISTIVDAILKESNADASKLIGNAISANRGFDATSLKEGIQAEIRRRFVEEKIRNLSEIANSNNAADKAFRMETLKMLERR